MYPPIMKTTYSQALENGAPPPSAGRKSRLTKAPLPSKLGPHDAIGEGDSRILFASVDEQDRERGQQGISCTAGEVPSFTSLKNEIYWQKMYHASGEVPRLVCVQGQREPDSAMPVYRHPSDQSLPILHYSPLVRAMSEQVQRIVDHPVNHCLIQLYRNGQDFISEHSDKTLDIVRGSSIVNVSLGAERTMRLRKKRVSAAQSDNHESQTLAPRETQLVPMPHGSVFILGPKTNMVWLHGINHDRRPPAQRSEEEKAFDGERISLTFRCIGTFLDPSQEFIWGQGACGKTCAEARPVMNGAENHKAELLREFSAENQSSSFDWDVVYGKGTDVLHFAPDPSHRLPLIFYSGDWLADTRIKMYLGQLCVPHKVGGVTGAEAGNDYLPTVCFRDTDELHTQLYGDMAILQHLQKFYAASEARAIDYRSKLADMDDLIQRLGTGIPVDWVLFLTELECSLRTASCFSEEFVSMADCIYWPLSDLAFRDQDPSFVEESYPRLKDYHTKMQQRPAVRMASDLEALGAL